jgi:predicted lipoprotein with Yx(FWY)xxD motif
MRTLVLRRTIFIGALVGALALAAIAVAASKDVTVSTHKTKKGTVVANAHGFSLYMFAKDTQGTKSKQPKSNCYGGCATVWPPLLVKSGGKPVAGKGSGLNSKLLGTVRRHDGTTQITYGGWPLYTYVSDRKAGEVTGQNVNQFGAKWYLLKPNGSLIKPGNGCPPGYVMTSSGCLPQSY